MRRLSAPASVMGECAYAAVSDQLLSVRGRPGRLRGVGVFGAAVVLDPLRNRPCPKPSLFRQCRSTVTISWRGNWMFTRQAPARTILIYAQSMGSSEMASEHLSAPATIEADDIIAMNGLPNRDGGCSLNLGFGCRFTEADERPMI